MADQIRVNGNMLSWGSISIKLDGERFHGFTKVNYADSRERVKAYGMGRHHAPRGRSRGKYSTDPVVIGGPKGSVQELRQALAARSIDGRSYGDVEFDVVVQYVESDDTPITVEIERCVWTKNTEQHEEGPDPLNEDFECDAHLIRRNGLVLFDESQGSP